MTGIVRELMLVAPHVGRYVGWCSTSGGLLALLYDLSGREWQVGFAIGVLLALGPLVGIFNSTKWVEAELEVYQRWSLQKRITKMEAAKLRAVTLDAMLRHRYGSVPDEAASPDTAPPPQP